jgi:putative ABC transport system permease protein
VSLLRQLTRGIRVLTRRDVADQDVSDEVQHYLDQATAGHIARGLSPDDALRAARLEVGNLTTVREQVRAYGWENVIGTVLSDLRFAARRLRTNPGFATVSVLTLALGIGATTAIFSAVNPILFEPLPYPDAGRIVMVWDYGPDRERIDVTFGTYRELVVRARSFDALAVMRPWQPTLTGAVEPERLDAQRVSAPYLRALGVSPALGRDFEAADDRPDGPRVVILSDGLWRRRFGGDSAIVGREIKLNDDGYTVIGVMPRAFANVLAPSAELWAPLQYATSFGPDTREWGHHLRMVGRVKPGVSIEQAARELDRIARDTVPDFPRVRWASLRDGLIVNSLQDDVTQAVKPALLAVLGAVLLVLVISCVNVTNLLLARSAQRRGEYAMRAALGAGRVRLMRQLLTESLLLALIGGALGMVVAELGVRALVSLSPEGLPRLDAIRLDAAVFLFGFAITTVIGLVVGVIPALSASGHDLQRTLQQGSRRTAGGHHVTRGALVVSEVALALVLLVSAGLLLRSLQQLFAVSLGFAPSQLLTMQVQTSGHRFDDDAVVRRFFEQSLEAVRRVPGVTSAAFTSQLPLSGDGESYGVFFESIPADDPNENQSAFRYAVTPGYFETMGIPIRRGRTLEAHDDASAPRVAVINESFARRKFPGRDPIGERMYIGDRAAPSFTVVGVVGDVKQASLSVKGEDAAYTTTEQWRFADNPLWLTVRVRGDAAALAPAVRSAIWSVDRDQPVVRIATMDDLVARSTAERRFALIVFEAFALAALILAATGIYGVLSGSVSERMREIGVRSALGASRGRILQLVVRQGMLLTAIGVGIGLVGAFAASQAIVSLLFGVTRLDPLTYGGVIALLVGVSLIACWLPAWRASRVDPAITLRAE